MEEVKSKVLMQPCGDGSGWFGHNWNVNLYRGCCHGCIYCDSRSSCYQVHEFDRVRCKQDALHILEEELRSKRRKGIVGLGAMSDPYNPFEREKLLTRGALQLLGKYGFGVSIATKSDLITRDAQLLADIAQHNPALAKITITAADDDLSRRVEGNVCPSSARFAALEALSKKGVFSGVLMLPVLPFIEDNEENILGIVRRASDSGARFIYTTMDVTLRGNQRQWFYDRLQERFPGVKEKYMKTFGEAYACASPRAEELYAAFAEACDRAGIAYKMPDIIAASRARYQTQQLSLFAAQI